MPLYDNSLKDYLKSNPNFEEKIGILCQISEGLELLHSRRIAQRNLHSGNVLIKAKETGMDAAIRYVGIVCFDDEEKLDYLEISAGSISNKIRIPIGEKSIEFPGFESDVYAFGFLMWECMHGIKLDCYESGSLLGGWIKDNLGKQIFDSSESEEMKNARYSWEKLRIYPLNME
jgi:serine/threonine protein kinase